MPLEAFYEMMAAWRCWQLAQLIFAITKGA
jgi:hypothetical protein